MALENLRSLVQAAGTIKKTNPCAWLMLHAQILHQISKIGNLRWSDDDEGALHVDPFPNPKEFLIAESLGIKIAVDCGAAGVGIGPGH